MKRAMPRTPVSALREFQRRIRARAAAVPPEWRALGELTEPPRNNAAARGRWRAALYLLAARAVDQSEGAAGAVSRHARDRALAELRSSAEALLESPDGAPAQVVEWATSFPELPPGAELDALARQVAGSWDILTIDQQRIVRALAKACGVPMKFADLADAAGFKANTDFRTRHLKPLQDLGIVRLTGKASGSQYELVRLPLGSDL